MKASAENLYETVNYLAHSIGPRLTGSEEERQAADYLCDQLKQYTPHVSTEEFPIDHRNVLSEKLELFINGIWIRFPGTLYNGAPTTDGKTLEADLEVFNAHTDYQREDLSYLHGKAVLHFGASFPTDDDCRRMMAAGPAFLLMVDTRFTSEIPLNDGLLPAQVRRYGAVPTMNVAFFDAWNWCSEHAARARLNVSGSNESSVSLNVIAELPGTDPDGGILYVGGHMDTASNTPGADDNASGCAAVVELARLLSERSHRNTIRLIAFGAEERLSVGSAEYARRHESELLKRGGFMCNFDTFASIAGWYDFPVSADASLRKELRDFFNAREIYYHEQTAPDPYNDLFPFTVYGIPGFTVLKQNCDSGVFYHHRPDNDLPNLSLEAAAPVVTAAAEFLDELADRDLSAYRVTDPDTTAEVKAMWESMF